MKASQALAAARSHEAAGEKFDRRGQWLQAVGEFRRACELAPNEGPLWLRLARAQWFAGSGLEAARSAWRAVELMPGTPLAQELLSGIFQQLMPRDVVEFFAQGSGNPHSEAQLVVHANALMALGREAEAVDVCLQVLRLNPRYANAHYALGRALYALKMGDQAAISFETALLTDQQGQVGVRQMVLPIFVHQLARNAEWHKLAEFLPQVLAMLDGQDERALSVLSVFVLLAFPVAPAQLRRVAELRARTMGGPPPLPPVAPAPRRPRLRVGWLSNDFFNHATAILIVGLLEQLDRSRFEVVLYCHSREDGSEIQQRVRAAADLFRDVRHLNDVKVGQLMRDDGIDIAIDLKGYTDGGRMQILAARPAPVQVSFLGFPGTTGAPFLDYVIGDPVVTPTAHEAGYSERIAQLPNSYQPNDDRRYLAPSHGRAEHGLPDDAVVLCCFNQTYKISEAQVDLWARILREAPGAVLWLLNWSTSASRRLAAAFQARGVDLQRLYFSEVVAAAENLARLQCADLFLDTWPCNAHTTASDALFAGVPVLTVPGETFASRVAASLVQACELPDFVCADETAYVERAVALACEPGQLRAAQARLRERRQTLPLFDTARYARDFGALLDRMWARHEAGLPPDHLAAQTAAAPQEVVA